MSKWLDDLMNDVYNRSERIHFLITERKLANDIQFYHTANDGCEVEITDTNGVVSQYIFPSWDTALDWAIKRYSL